MTIRRGLRCLGVITVLLVLTAIPGCGWRGLNSVPLPGTEGSGDGSFTIQAEMPNVSNIQENSRVRVGDVNVGTVTRIERQDWHALLTMKLNGDVVLPANATAMVGQTSLLGSLHIELAPPTTEPARGQLEQGSVIALSSAGEFPSTEQTLAAASLLLNGGGLAQVQDITEALSTAFNGREDDLRSLLHQVGIFIGAMNDQTGDIIAATDSLDGLMAKFAAQKPVMDKAFGTIPEAVAVLNRKRDKMIDAVDLLGKFSALAADSVAHTKESLVAELEDLGPVLESLANAGPALTRSLSLLTTYPFTQENLTKWFRGDYANISLLVDLTLSRMDSSFFTGTRFEGDLTELEMQWGRTIGQIPSPYTAANPLLAPYRFDQGR